MGKSHQVTTARWTGRYQMPSASLVEFIEQLILMPVEVCLMCIEAANDESCIMQALFLAWHVKVEQKEVAHAKASIVAHSDCFSPLAVSLCRCDCEERVVACDIDLRLDANLGHNSSHRYQDVYIYIYTHIRARL